MRQARAPHTSMQNASHGPHACDSLGIQLIRCNGACCQPSLAHLPLEAPLPSLLCSWGSLALLFPTQVNNSCRSLQAWERMRVGSSSGAIPRLLPPFPFHAAESAEGRERVQARRKVPEGPGCPPCLPLSAAQMPTAPPEPTSSASRAECPPLPPV